MNSNPQKTIQQLVHFLFATFQSAGLKNAVIGVSGGVDSATSLALAVRALGKDQVFPLLLPYGRLNQSGVVDATVAINALRIPSENVVTIDIQPAVDTLAHYDPRIDPLRKGNMMARVRMIFLFDQAKKQKAMVVGTENKTEHLLGYYTRFGDEASDVEPLRELYKTQVYELARSLQIPEPILTKAPTAGLWEGQTDEGEFGFPYKIADEILSFVFDAGKTADEVIHAGYKKDLVDRVLALVQKNDFKHHLPHIA